MISTLKSCRILTATLIPLTLIACATPLTDGTSYNKGVEAYRAKDYTNARVHWSRAVDDGNISALNNLGYLFYYGLGGGADPERAVSLWMKGAMAGHSEAQWHLGRAFEDGKGTRRDYIQAYAWYRCALASSQAGTGVDQDAERQIAEDVKTSLVILVDKLSPEQFDQGAHLAKQYIAMYVKPN